MVHPISLNTQNVKESQLQFLGFTAGTTDSYSPHPSSLLKQSVIVYTGFLTLSSWQRITVHVYG